MADNTPRMNIQQVSDALLGKWKAERLESRELVRSNPSLHTIPGQPMDEHRIRVLNPRDRNSLVFEEIVANIKSLGLKKPVTVTPVVIVAPAARALSARPRREATLLA